MSFILPNSRHQVARFILLVSLGVIKSSTGALFHTPTQPRTLHWGCLHRQRCHKDEELELVAKRFYLKGLFDGIKSLDRTFVLKVARGGGSFAETGSVSKENLDEGEGQILDEHVTTGKPTSITMGVIDLSATRTDQPDLHASIIVLVDGESGNDSITIDENTVRTNLEEILSNGSENEISHERSADKKTEDINAVVEGFAVVCDVLVIRMNEDESLSSQIVACISRGNKQRTEAGLAGGRLWMYGTKGTEKILKKLVIDRENEGKTNDDIYRLTTTTCSTLFASYEGNNRRGTNTPTNDLALLKDMVDSLSRQVIRFYRRSRANSNENAGAKIPFPVSVRYLSKNSSPNMAGEIPAKKNQERMKNIGKHHDDNEAIARVMSRARGRLDDLEMKMHELVLDQSSNQMPLLEFGSLAHDILKATETQLRTETKTTDRFCRALLKGMVADVQRLYKDQLQALRNYYGRRYETIIDEEVDDGTNVSTERRWAIGAEHMTQGFIAAAKNAVPTMYREDLEEANFTFDHDDALQGLIRDMIESTERRKDEQNTAVLLMSEEEEESGKAMDNASTPNRKVRLPAVPQWLERLAARAFVFGVNYIQGWLAWQGIKIAALERDRSQPKFPLF